MSEWAERKRARGRDIQRGAGNKETGRKREKERGRVGDGATGSDRGRAIKENLGLREIERGRAWRENRGRKRDRKMDREGDGKW